MAEVGEGLGLPYGLKPVNPVLVDVWAGPYSSIAQANLDIPLAVRKQTRFVNIIDAADSNKGKIYWYKDGVQDENLVPLLNIDLSSLNFTNANPTPLTVAGIPSGSTFDNKTNAEMWNMLLYPELFPTLVNPDNSLSSPQSGLHEIGEILNVDFNGYFNRGSISPAYGTNGFRSGLPNTYRFTGSGVGDITSTSLGPVTTSLTNYTIIQGPQTWNCKVLYDAGEQPKSSYDNNFSTPLSAGETSNKSVTLTGVYPWYYNSGSLTVSTKQSLVANGSQVVSSMLAEDGINKQFVEFPAIWGDIVRIEQYNTLSNQWDIIALDSFTSSTTTKVIQSNVINYNKYTYNGSTSGARQLRFSTI